jgi:hypothetical protein
MPHLPHLPALALGFSHFMGHSYIVAAVLGASVAAFGASVVAFGASAFGTATFSIGNAVVFVGVPSTFLISIAFVSTGLPVVFGASSHEVMNTVAKNNNLNNFILILMDLIDNENPQTKKIP